MPADPRRGAKERGLEILAALPDGSGYDELICALGFQRAIERGLHQASQAAAGREDWIDHRTLRDRVASWRP